MKVNQAVAIASFVGLAVAGVPTSAQARSHTTPDPAGDVMQQFEGTGGSEAAPTRAEGDVLASGVTHRPRRVIVAMRFAAMTQTPAEVIHEFFLRTNERKVRRVTVIVYPGAHNTTTSSLTNGRGDDVKCRMTTTISNAQRRATVSIPRRCLSSPRWVRVGMKSVTIDGGSYYTDDGQTGAPRLMSEEPVFGPRVRRG